MEKTNNKLFYMTLGVYIMLSIMVIVSSQLRISKFKEEVKSLKEENRVLKNEVQLREGEISYWGMKYDSICKTNIIIE